MDGWNSRGDLMFLKDFSDQFSLTFFLSGGLIKLARRFLSFC